MLVGCDSASKVSGQTDDLLKSFGLKVGTYTYHADIDQETGLARIGGIEYGGQTNAVRYELAEGAAIEPDPNAFVSDWPEEQTFTVTDGVRTKDYKVVLTSYVADLPETEGKELIFFDDFNSPDNRLDQDLWKYVPKGTAAWQADMSGSPDQAYIENGNLVLVAEKTADGVLKAGGIKSEYLQNIQWPCHIEAKCRFVDDCEHVGQAFWLMPDSRYQTYQGWPDGGEIDIMEHSYLHDYVQQTVHTHYIDRAPGNNYMGKPVYYGYNQDRYNIYGLDILENEIVFYVNGIKTGTYSNMKLADEAVQKQWPFRAPYYVILSISPNGEKRLEPGQASYMYIDWVKAVKL